MGSGDMTAAEVAALLDLKPHPRAATTLRPSATPPSPSPPPSSASVYVQMPDTTSRSSFKWLFCCPSLLLCSAVLNKVGRAVSTAIYFLLPAGSVSRLHRIPCAETWHFYKGEPLTVFELHDDGHIDLTVIGPHLDAGQRPQYTVPPNVWFGSFPTLDVESFASDGSFLVNSRKRDPEKHYSLVGCTCAPGFEYEDFEMATFDDVKSIAPKAEPFLSYLIPSTK
ncbi:hypothetical protein ACQ4PT_066236 [Festuca glaucescens]